MSEEHIPPYTGWGFHPPLTELLRQLALSEHNDVSIAAEAAKKIEWIQHQNSNLRYAVSVLLEALDDAAEALDSDNPDIQLRAAVAARETLKRIEGGA